MDSRTSRLASQLTRLLPLCAALFALAGCKDVNVINRTASTFSENPSQVYTLTAEVQIKSGIVVKNSVQANIVIDGQNFPMHKSDLGKDIWEYDYRLPPGRTQGAYYFLVQYQTESDGHRNQREAYIDLARFSVVNRYSLTLDVNRAPVGAQVTILGRGFTPQDIVYVGDQAAQTSFRSQNTLQFAVPPLPAAMNYEVSIGAPGTGLKVGTLRIDEGTLSVFPNSVSVATGQRRQIVFKLPSAAPAGGLMLDITTDVPASVIMPEVTIPAGAETVNVVVQGGQPGSGTIFIKAPGFGETTVSVTVTGR